MIFESGATVIMICGFFTKIVLSIVFRIAIAPALSIGPYILGPLKKDIHPLTEAKC
jgi:hypothetical protein